MPTLALDDSDYTLFGLPPTYQLDPTALQQAYLKLQNMAHPDRHAQGTPQEQRMAMQWTTRINQAYSRLKNPTERAVYWCTLHGENPKSPSTPLPAEHLAQHMDWHEALSELQHTQAAQAPQAIKTPEAIKPLEALRQEVLSAQSQLYAQLLEAADRQHNVAKACQHTQALLYIHQFLHQLDNTLASLEDTL